jgi:hypothetical protein
MFGFSGKVVLDDCPNAVVLPNADAVVRVDP